MVAARKKSTPAEGKKTKPNPLAQPFLKWAGGKRQLLPEIRKHMPKAYKDYYEPFVGGGAVLFDVQPKRAFINDANEELVNLYTVIKESPQALLETATRHKNQNSEDHFYKVREQDRDRGTYAKLTPVERAARIMYLNKTCYNGLFRVNSRGEFNVPYGKYANPTIAERAIINAVSNYLNAADVRITNHDFEVAVAQAKKGDFVYFDPPYDPVSDTASFTGYHFDSFGKAEQKRLRDVYKTLSDRGCKVMLSNSATDFIRELYADYRIVEVEALRAINSVAAGRGKVSEFLILNY